MTVVRPNANKPGTDANREPARPSPPKTPAAPTKSAPRAEPLEDADFGEEFGHAVKKGGTAGGEGFQGDQYDKLV